MAGKRKSQADVQGGDPIVKVLTYKYENMVRAGKLLNALHFCGVDQARIIAELGNILDSGTPGNITEMGKEVEEDAMEQQEICQD